MMMDARFSDEDLTAYLDGEAPDDLRAEIDAALVTDTALADRLAALDIPLGQIGASFDRLLADAPAMPALSSAFAPQPANLNRGVGWLGGAALFGTGIAAGIAIMMFAAADPPAPPVAPGWKAVVASYQSLYLPATLAEDTPTAAQALAQLASVSQLAGADLTSLPDIEGLTFKRAQILGFNGKPLVQIAFARADGTPVALCIIAANSKEAKAMQAETLGGMAAASWNRDGRAYLLIGGDAAEATQSEAAAFEAWAETVADI